MKNQFCFWEYELFCIEKDWKTNYVNISIHDLKLLEIVDRIQWQISMEYTNFAVGFAFKKKVFKLYDQQY